MSIAYKMYIFDLMSQREQEQQQHLRSMDPRCSRSKKVPMIIPAQMVQVAQSF